MRDTISSITHSTVETVKGQESDSNMWLYIVITGLIVIILLLLVIINRRQKIANHVGTNVNDLHTEQAYLRQNIMNIGKKLNGETQILYDKLRKACHPDRFSNDEHKIAIATDLISKVNQSKDKYSDLEVLKVEIEKLLNIRIN